MRVSLVAAQVGAQSKNDWRDWDKSKELFEKGFQEADGTDENTKTVREAMLFS